jgi:predicted methyltransferase
MRAVFLLSAVVLASATAPADQPRHSGHGGTGGVERWLPVLENSDRDAWQRPDEVVALMTIEPGMTVADLGAGTGYFLARLDSAVGESGRVLALDVDPELVNFMADRAAREDLTAVEVRVVAPDDPGLESASVDRVLVVDTWHHLPDRGAYARRLAAALRPGGAVVVVDLELDAPIGPPRDHRLAAAVVQAELESAGLAARVVEESLPYQYVVLGELPSAR